MHESSDFFYLVGIPLATLDRVYAVHTVDLFRNMSRISAPLGLLLLVVVHVAFAVLVVPRRSLLVWRSHVLDCLLAFLYMYYLVGQSTNRVYRYII